MSDRINSLANNAYLMFVFDFADPSAIDKEKILPDLLAKGLFDSQKTADKVKRHLKNDFNQALSLYFNQFNKGGRVDVDALDSSIVRGKKTMLRHLGKEKLNYLSLIVSLLRETDKSYPKKGLLSLERAI